MCSRLRSAGRARSITLGRTRISWIPDGQVQLKPRGWFVDTADEEWHGYDDHLDDDGCLVAGVGGVLVQREGRAMLIDAGFGVLQEPDTGDPIIGAARGGALLAGLREHGIVPGTLDLLAITHLHTDHIGWALADDLAAPELAGVPIMIDRTEWENRAARYEQGLTPAMLDRLADRVRTVAPGEEIWPGVHAIATRGHTQGHTSFLITDGERRAVVLGDALHSSLQVRHPAWRSAPDVDHATAVAGRRALLDLLEEPGTIGVAGHFADVVFGRVVSDADGRRWEPVA